MTDLLDAADTADTGDPGAVTHAHGGKPHQVQEEGAEGTGARTAGLAAAAAALATVGAGWMAAGVFPGWGPRALAILAALLGPAAVALSARVARPAMVQVGGAVAIAGAAAVSGLVGRVPGASLPTLVADALRGGGLADAPVAFDPGWRVLLVVVVGLLGFAAAGLAAAFGRPRLVLPIVAPVLAVGTLVQPPGAEITSASVAIAAVVAAFGVAAAADLVQEGASSARFELGRIARGGAVLAALVVVLVVAGRSGVLLPKPADDVVVPPQRPRPSPPLGDRELFRVRADRALPLRLGTLDVYRDNAWMTPPFDPGRLEPPTANGKVRHPKVEGPDQTVTAEFTVGALTGRALPSLANPVLVSPAAGLETDPRTQVVRVEPGTSGRGRRYVVVAAAPPDGVQLSSAPTAGPDMAEFLDVPPAPPEIAELLQDLPDTDPFNRLQAARQAYYDGVVAAGAGDPVDVSPARVAELLSGQEGTPFEITAGEALLARWVGVPARLGYGWFVGASGGGKSVSVRPQHGATWLEAWFDGYGWVPLVGRPPRAKASLSKDAKSADPSIRPTDRLTVFTYVPVRREGLRQSAEVVRWWLARIVPLAVGIGLAWRLWPVAVKWRRRRARRRWAADGGPAARLGAAYGEVRDVLTDLGVARASATPLEALASAEPDEEHRQLAWLVTRGLWGDLARDLTDDDAGRGEAMAASVRRRLQKAQPLGPRLAAHLSPASLRDPWGADLPPTPHSRGNSAPNRRAIASRMVVAGVAVVVAVGVLALATRGGDTAPPIGDPARAGVGPLREPVVADVLLGDVAVRREARAERAFVTAGASSLVAAGRVYSLTVGPSVEGSLQAAALRADVAGRGDEVVADVLDSLAGGGFRPARFGGAQGYELTLPDQRVAVWFTPDLRAYLLLVTRRSFTRADDLFASVIATQRGRAAVADDVPVPDPRRVLP